MTSLKSIGLFLAATVTVPLLCCGCHPSSGNDGGGKWSAYMRDSSARSFGRALAALPTSVDAAEAATGCIADVSDADEARRLDEAIRIAASEMGALRATRFASAVDSLSAGIPPADMARFMTLAWSPSRLGRSLSASDDQSLVEAIRKIYGADSRQEFDNALNP